MAQGIVNCELFLTFDAFFKVTLHEACKRGLFCMQKDAI